jgi:hypothetical protein
MDPRPEPTSVKVNEYFIREVPFPYVPTPFQVPSMLTGSAQLAGSLIALVAGEPEVAGRSSMPVDDGRTVIGAGVAEAVGIVADDNAAGFVRSPVMSVVMPPPVSRAPMASARAAVVAADAVRARHDRTRAYDPAAMVRPPATTVARPVPSTTICAIVLATASQAMPLVALAQRTPDVGGYGCDGMPDKVTPFLRRGRVSAMY